MENYPDSDLMIWFDEVAKGYPFEEACQNVGYDWPRLLKTIYSDNDVYIWALDLSMIAGAKIREGLQPAVKRHDGLYDEYLDDHDNHD